MKVYRLRGKKNCDVCTNDADFYVDGLDAAMCKDCALELYKSLGMHFIPRSIPNVILRSEKHVVAEVKQTENIDAEEIKSQGEINEKSRESNPEKIKIRSTKWQKKNRK